MQIHQPIRPDLGTMDSNTMANDQEGMDCGALHLKPFVIIDCSHVQEDQAVGPESTVSNRPADDGSFFEKREEICINTGRPILVEKSTEQYEKSENPLYTGVSMRNRTVPYHIIVCDSSIFYEKAVYNEEVVEERPCEAEVEQSHDEDVQYVTDSLFQNLHWFTEDSPVEKLNLEDVFFHKHHYFHHVRLAVKLEAELQKLSSCFPKVSEKRQRRKKMIDLFGAFDTFHYLKPVSVQAVVFPVQRQKKGKDQQPGNQAAGESSGSGNEARPWPPESMNGRPWADFRQELYRLGTFVNIPASFPVSVLRLARAGFLCMPDGVILCYFCGMQHDQWRVGQFPLGVHRRMNPNCSVLTGVNCNNIPVTVPVGDQVQPLMQIWSLSGPSPLSDSGRDPDSQITAANQGEVLSHTSHMSMIYLAQSAPSPHIGNQHVGGLGPSQISATAPASGQGAIANSHQNVTVSYRPARTNADGEQANEAAGAGGISQDSDQQQQEVLDGAAQPGHQKGAGGSSSAAAGEGRTRQVVTYSQLGIIREAPTRPDMATVRARVASFRNWPFTDTLTPLALAQAGFHYAGFGNCTRCFHCGGGLQNWNPTDNPWVEHARRFSNCAYIRLCQGQEFIDVVSELSNQGRGSSGDPVLQISMAQVQEDMNARHLAGDYIPERTLDPAMCAVQTLGCSQDAIDAAAQQLQADGHQLTVDRLVDYLERDGVFAGADVQDLAEEGDETEVEQLARQNVEMRQQHLCKICMDQEANIVFLTCGHMVCCTECSPPVVNCPLCRQKIKGKLRAFPC